MHLFLMFINDAEAMMPIKIESVTLHEASIWAPCFKKCAHNVYYTLCVLHIMGWGQQKTGGWLLTCSRMIRSG